MTMIQSQYALLSSQFNMGNVDRLTAALASLSATIVVVGDSIMEGRDLCYEDSPIGVIRRALIDQNGWANIRIVNLSLAGRGMGSLADPNNVGMAPPENPAQGFYRPPGAGSDNVWPNGSVVGKNWLNHVRDAAPDFVVIALGANDNSGNGPAIAASLKYVIGQMQTWAKIPSIGLVATTVPSKLVPLGLSAQDAIQTAADVARGVARELNLTLFDANRHQLLLRDAVDVDNKKYSLDQGFTNFPSGWLPSAGATFVCTNGQLAGSGSVYRDVISEDIHLTATFTLIDYTTQTANLVYRAADGNLAYTAQLNGGNLWLYYASTRIGGVAISPPVNGVPVTMKAVVRGAKHEIYINGVLRLSMYSYDKLRGGKHGLFISGAPGIITNYSAKLGQLVPFGDPQMTDVDIFGANDFATNPDSAGGNALNHPTKLAVNEIYGAAFLPLLCYFKRLR